jgi:hypothetical protein
MLVTVDRYRTVTGDHDTPTDVVADRLDEAVDLCEDTLLRPLAALSRTERMVPTRDGRLWPRCTPLVAAPGYDIDGYALLPSAFTLLDFTGRTTAVTVTYTGGFVERSANPAATNRLPIHIERDVCWVAKALDPAFASTVAALPPGARSVSLGDISVTFADTADGAVPSMVGVRWSKRTLAWRHMQVGGSDSLLVTRT